ncbi:hypothetical protein B1H18_14215 [Streptomyces tsukubensis]|uniref:BioF2-like acetyltransferase domain-containing protein n=2 Tax=Streptomyces tsukubensis TaxID=83656 RepID=A0A1V4A913_9ACTN|nr:hypothetical protein B1H18_14215 [Streptomyces tsukubensis]
MHAGYHWRNSGHPAVTRWRTAVDTRDSAVFPAVRSDLNGMSVSYAGLAEGLAYTLEFTELRRETGSGKAARRTSARISGKALGAVSRLPDADVTIVGTSAARARQMTESASLIIPMRIHFVLDTQGGSDTARRKISKRERSQFNHDMKLRDWSWSVERDPAWFDFFYDRLYRPTMRNRHGTRERTETKEVSYECLFRSGRMFSLSQNGEHIAGALCHWDPATQVLTLRLLGVLDGSEEHYDNGAFKAIYHFLIGWAADNGVRFLDFQGTEPFLSKGTYQWKRRFGTRVILPPNHFGNKRLWLQVRRDTPEVRDFLVANPVLAEDVDGSLRAVYFHDSDRPARRDYSAKSPGVARVDHVDLDSFLASVPQNLDRRTHP